MEEGRREGCAGPFFIKRSAGCIGIPNRKDKGLVLNGRQHLELKINAMTGTFLVFIILPGDLLA